MNDFPMWVTTLTETDLNAQFGVVSMARGQLYATMGRVGSVVTTSDGATAAVRGGNLAVYRTAIRQHNGLITECTCPAGHRCKHAVALILHLRTMAEGTLVPDWQRFLEPLLEQEETSASTALALEFFDSLEGLAIRPLRQGSREPWVRSGASWEEITRGRGTFIPTHRAVICELHEARKEGSLQDHLRFADLRPEAWDILRRALWSGMPLLAGTDPAGRALPTPRLVTEPAELWLSIDKTADGIRVTPQVTCEGRSYELTAKALLGYPAHGIALRSTEELLLAPLNRRLDNTEHTLIASGPLEVPKHQLSLFTTGYVPALRERFTVTAAPEVELPPVAEPVLVCQAAFSNDTVTVHWVFRYTLDGNVIELEPQRNAQEPPIRNLSAQRRIVGSLPTGSWRTGYDLHSVRLTGRTLVEFVSSTMPTLAALPSLVVETTGVVPYFDRATQPPEISISVAESPLSDWFDLTIEVSVAGQEVPLAELLRALADGEDHLILDSGLWFSLEVPELDQLRKLIEEARELVGQDQLRLRPEHASLWADLAEIAVIKHEARRWRDTITALLETQQPNDDAPPAGLKAELRPYQQAGYRWLRTLWRGRFGGILADEMGLGKTMQALAMAQAAFEDGELTHPILVVAPTTVLGTWVAEAAKFTPELKVARITETAVRRGVDLAEAIGDAQIVCTSYTLLRLEAEHYQALPWSAVLLDEAQFVKNRGAKAHQAVRRLNTSFTVALTGTPLENNLMDLWSLLALTAPGLFPDPRKFTERYRTPIERGDQESLHQLRRRVSPLMLRRTKDLVAKELPPKQVQLVPVELSAAHRALYERHLVHERQKVLGLVDDLSRNRINILRSLTKLRQLSLSPSLIDETYPEHSAKIDTLVDLVEELISEGHRGLVFSQFTGFLALVQRRLQAEGIDYVYLDGSTKDRQQVVDEFRSGDAPLFLISLKAGGFGLNLTEADYVFILDPWWNPAAENQAIDRAHRIGQDKPVNVYRLVAANTIEEKVVALQEAKRELFDNVVGSGVEAAAPLSAADIRALLEDY